MISKDSNLFKHKLYNILKDLSSLESGDIVMKRCIEDKLTKSYEQYQNTVKNIYNYVLTRSNLKVIKALSKIKKTKENANGNKSN